MIVEVQFYIDVFLAERKLVHIFYKIQRATSWLALTMDCAPKCFPVAGNTMACSTAEAADRLALGQLPGVGADPLFAEQWDFAGSKKIGTAGVEMLARTLARGCCRALRVLNLGFNGFGDRGCARVANVLASASLRELDLRSNSIGHRGCARIARALATNVSLQKLDLSYNDVGDQGCAHIAEALATNTSLRELNLSGNHGSNASLQELSNRFLETHFADSDSNAKQTKTSDNRIGEQAKACLRDICAGKDGFKLVL